jgi:hypothetical protein
MSDQTAPIYGKNGEVSGHLDLSAAQWRLAAPGGAVSDGGDYFEIAFVPHADGVTYTAMRKVQDRDGKVLVYTPGEWDAFLDGAANGEFDVFLPRKQDQDNPDDSTPV